MARIAIFVGTRPEAVKLAPVIKALQADRAFEPVVVGTGQHQQMLMQVLNVFDIQLDHDLAVMQPNQTLASLTARLMIAVDSALETIKPDMALVQGDTTTVLVAALACFYRRIPIGHVEAGLRTYNIWAPFPEEANRTLASKIVTQHYAPTQTARHNLLKEGISDSTIYVTGNTVIDALHLEQHRQLQPEVHLQIQNRLAQMMGAGWDDKPYVLITGHRRENFGQGFLQICRAIAELAQHFPNHRFIYPVHLNPNVQKPVYEMLNRYENVHLIEPQAYSEFVALLAGCKLVLTDSGGVQEEAPGLGKPVLVMRETTERPEGVEAGTVALVGSGTQHIFDSVSHMLTNTAAYHRMAVAVNPYGDGKASARIVAAMRRFLYMDAPPASLH